MEEELKIAQKDLNKLKEQSLAYEMIQDYKKQNKRLFVIWIITFLSFLALLGYTIYLLNDIGTIEETTISQENDNGYNNYIGNDGDITNGKANNN